MPSKKTRKKTKTPVKLSYSDQSTSPSLIPSTPTPQSKLTLEEDEISSLLDEASLRFPSLISKDAFVGRIVDVESNSVSRDAKIFLSESAMLDSRLVPGSIVSVSLASSRENLFISPLDSFSDECGCSYGIDVTEKGVNDDGTYFTLAVVYPSSKVLKNGVRLSQSLSCTMGNPAVGKTTFVSLIQTRPIGRFGFLSRSTDGPLDGIDKLRQSNYASDSCLSLCNCRDLYLELVPLKNGHGINLDMPCPINSTPQNQLRNGNISSPKMSVSYTAEPSSSVSCTGSWQKSDSIGRHPYRSLSNAFDVEEALADEKSREVLQTCVSLCLRARLLLRGNLVSISLSGTEFMFLVHAANTSSLEFPNEDIMCEEKRGACHANQNSDVDHKIVAYIVDCKTRVHLNSSSSSVTRTVAGRGFPVVKLDRVGTKDMEAAHAIKLGGLSKEYAILKEIIMSSSVNGPLSSLGIRSIKGVLIHGPPGTGKTSLARSCVNDAGFKLFLVKGPEIISQFLGESEQALCKVFDSASQAAPSVVFIDELDAIAPARKDGGDELSQRMVATLLNLMDGISSSDGVLVIAATNRPDSIDPALRRPGRLDREIEIGVPSPKQRFDILHTLLKEMDHSLGDTQIQHLSSSTHGFVGSDLSALCNEAALICLRRHIKFHSSGNTSAMKLEKVQLEEPSSGYDRCLDDTSVGSGLSTCHEASLLSHSDPVASSESVKSFDFISGHQQGLDTSRKANHSRSDEVTSELGEEALLQVCFDDFEKAKMKVRPSAMREVILEIPKVSWEDVGGQNEVKKQLMEAVEWPQKHQDAFKRIGTRPPTGVLMFGPPGCSKTLMARAVASEAGLNFLAVKGPELFSKWVGESEKAVKTLFAKARANAPSIIFFDEIDGLAIIRGKENDGTSVSDRVMSQLLVELDGLHERVDVTVIAATNRPDKIDPALLRPGRFDRLLYVGPPTKADREDIFRIHARKMPCSSDVSIRQLACLTDGCTGADISLICREAALATIEETVDAAEISMSHFMIGLGRVQPSEVKSYQEFSTKFQRHVLIDGTSDGMGCQPNLSSCNRITFWNRVKCLSQMLFRWPAAFLH